MRGDHGKLRWFRLLWLSDIVAPLCPEVLSGGPAVSLTLAVRGTQVICKSSAITAYAWPLQLQLTAFHTNQAACNVITGFPTKAHSAHDQTNIVRMLMAARHWILAAYCAAANSAWP